MSGITRIYLASLVDGKLELMVYPVIKETKNAYIWRDTDGERHHLTKTSSSRIRKDMFWGITKDRAVRAIILYKQKRIQEIREEITFLEENIRNIEAQYVSMETQKLEFKD